MRFIRRLFLLLCLCTTIFAVWAAIYTRREGFTVSWRNAIEREFESRGYHVDIGKLTLGAFRGLVAEDVRFFQDATRTQEVAFLDDVYLDVDLSRILNRKQISVNTLDVQEASLSLPLDPSNPDGKRLHVRKLSGRIVITESVIEITKAEAVMAGVGLSIKGSLVRPPLDYENPPEIDREKEMEKRRGQIARILEELDTYEFFGERPEVEIEFRGDLSDLTTTTAKARVNAADFSKRGQTYRIDSLSADLRFDGLQSRAEIDSVLIRDAEGSLNLTGSWSQESGRLEFNVESDADISSLAGLLWDDKKLGEVVFFNPPSVKASGFFLPGKLREESSRGFPGEIIGEFRSERFVTRGTVFAGLDFGFSAVEDRFYVRSLRLDHITGVAFLNLKYEPGKGDGTLQYQAEVKLDPLVFRPFFDEKGREFIDAWNFGETSAVYLAAAGQGSDWSPSTWQTRGVVDLRHFRLNGVTFQEMEADFESEGATQRFRNVAMVREEGKIVAELATRDRETNQWEVKGVVSTVDPIEGARAFSPKLAEALTRYRHSSPPTVRLAGMIDARRMEEVGEESRRNELKITFTGGGNAKYDFLGKTLTLSDPEGEVVINRSHVHLTTLTAGIFGGSIELNYDAKNVRSREQPFVANVRILKVPLEAVTKHYGDTEAAKGSVDTSFRLSGNAAQVSTLRGEGNVRVSEGNLFAIPVLGPLSKMVEKGNTANGELGPRVAKDASANFRIENGVLITEDIEALTDTFRVRAAGTVSLADLSVDLDAVVNTRGGLSSAILTPLSELLTYSCTGTVMEPVWKPKHISNIGKVPAQIISEMTNIPLEGLKKIGQGIFGPQEKREDGSTIPQEEKPSLRRLFQPRSN